MTYIIVMLISVLWMVADSFRMRALPSEQTNESEQSVRTCASVSSLICHRFCLRILLNNILIQYCYLIFLYFSTVVYKSSSNFCVCVCVCLSQGLKNQVQVKLSVVSCPPVTMVLIKRPDLQYPLGFSVQNGIVSQL